MLSALWLRQATWAVSVPLAMAVRAAGLLASLVVMSWVLRENVLTLVVAQTVALLDQVPWGPFRGLLGPLRIILGPFGSPWLPWWRGLSRPGPFFLEVPLGPLGAPFLAPESRVLFLAPTTGSCGGADCGLAGPGVSQAARLRRRREFARLHCERITDVVFFPSPSGFESSPPLASA